MVNVFRSRDRRDREYGKAGRILRDRHYAYLYDVEGNLILKTPRRGLTQHPNHEVSEEGGTHIVWQTGDYAYEWYGNGMLKEVRLPYGKTVHFEYDALGRRTAKLFNGLSHGEGPSIWMETTDHRMTSIHGWQGKEGALYRQTQLDLINQGKFADAIQMDIDDIQSSFGSKYDSSINEMLDYSYEKGLISEAERDKMKICTK